MAKSLVLLCTLIPAKAIDTGDDSLNLVQKRAKAQHTSSDSGSKLRSRYDDKCMDFNFNNNNVYMHPCHGGANQQFSMDNERLMTKHDDNDDKCLDYNYNTANNVYMYPCHSGSNQQWFFNGELLQTRHDSKCLDYNFNNDNIYMHPCNGGSHQNFYFSPPSPGYNMRFKSRHQRDEMDLCMEYNTGNDNVRMILCQAENNQKFYLDGSAMKTMQDNKCLDYNFNNNNVYMHPCHGGNNQQWYFDGEEVKTKRDGKCLDFNFNNDNIYMHPCHAGSNQLFYLENFVQDLEHDEVVEEIAAEEAADGSSTTSAPVNCATWCTNRKKSSFLWCGKKCAWKSCVGCTFSENGRTDCSQCPTKE